MERKFKKTFSPKHVTWPPGNMLAPVPAALVSLGDSPENYNMLTIAWTGTLASTPPMTYVSIRPQRHSHGLLMRTRAFVINLTTKEMAAATDWCGVVSGKDVNKFQETGLTPVPSESVNAPYIAQSPVCLSCRVTEIKPLGSHDLFIAEIVSVHVREDLINPAGRLMLEKAGLIAYCHGHYYGMEARPLGKFGYSVEKKKTKAKRK